MPSAGSVPPFVLFRSKCRRRASLGADASRAKPPQELDAVKSLVKLLPRFSSGSTGDPASRYPNAGRPRA